MSRHQHLALVVDDQVAALDAVRPVLRSLRHAYHHARTQVEAEALLERERYCYVLLDLEFPADDDCVARIETGFNFLADLRTRFGREELPVIVTTAHEKGAEYPIRALQLNANDFAQKANDGHEPLDVKIRRILERTCPPGGHPEPAPSAAHRLHFHGDCRRRRYRLEFDEREVYVRLTTFTILWRLATALHRSPPGWVAGRTLNPGNYHNALARLREDLRDRADFAGELIEGDGHGGFRLATEVAVTHDPDAMAANHPGLLAG
ncbi:MAG: response regulator [Planctomycetota bacterium]